jgi:hypothetical protein
MSLLIAAAVGAGLGAIAGGIGVSQKEKAEKKRIEQEKRAALDALAFERTAANSAFGRAKAEASRSAGKADRTLDRQAGLLEDSYDRLSGDYNLQMAARGLENTAARTGLEQSYGAALSDLGYSGVRSNSSSYEAASASNDLYRRRFEASLKQQDAADESLLRQTLQGYDDSFYGIAEGRRETSELRASFEEGGLQKQAYKDQLAAFDFREGQINSGAAFANEAATAGALDYVTGILGGMNTGMDMASGWYMAATYSNPAGKKKGG